MNKYWTQFDKDEIRSMHGADFLENDDEEIEKSDYQDDDQNDNQNDSNACPRCTHGCADCLL
jgi:hypothetical protein